MIKKLMLIPVLLSLSAFTCTPKPKTEIITQQVYCVTPDQYAKLKDAEPQSIRDALTGQAQQDFKITAGQDVLLRIYADGLLKVLGGCIGPAPSDA